MKTYAKKLLLTSAIAVGLFSSTIQNSQAATANIDATVTTRPAVTVAQTTAMSFGAVDVDISNPGTSYTGSLVLNTDGTVTYPTGVVNAPTGSTPAAGVITIGSDGVSPLDVTCANTGQMKSGTNTLDLSVVKIKAVSGTSDLAADHTCTGALEASLITPSAASTVLNMGATIAGLGATTQLIVAGLQNYTTVGNTPIAFTVVYH